MHANNSNLGIPRSTPHTITIYGSTMYYTLSSSLLTKYLTKSYKVKEISENKALKLFNTLKEDSRFSIKFVFETDKEIVNKTKEHLLNLAKGKRV